MDALLTQISNLDRADRWSALARAAVRQDLYAAQAGLTVRVLRRTDPGLPPEERIAQFEKANPEGLTRARTTLAEIRECRSAEPGHGVGGAAGASATCRSRGSDRSVHPGLPELDADPRSRGAHLRDRVLPRAFGRCHP